MMYCLRSYIPLLLLPLPLSLSPLHLTLLLLTTYFLNRPCIYCSFLLLILFASSCHWSGRCFFDFSSPASPSADNNSSNSYNYYPSTDSYGYSGWFTPGIYTVHRHQHKGTSPASTSHDEYGREMSSPEADVSDLVSAAVNSTVSALAGAAFEEAKRRLSPANLAATRMTTSSGLPESAGIGLGWLRSLLGRSEWTIPCLEIMVRL